MNTSRDFDSTVLGDQSSGEASGTARARSGVRLRQDGWGHSLFGLLCVGVILALRFSGEPPITFIFDPNRDHCLTTVHFGIFFHHPPAVYHGGDLVVFKPNAALAYVRDPYVMKQIAGLPGDHVVIAGENISVNGRLVARGLPLASLYGVSAASLQRDEVVPPNRLFVFGDAAHSDDSRYWGYLDTKYVVGTAKKLL